MHRPLLSIGPRQKETAQEKNTRVEEQSAHHPFSFFIHTHSFSLIHHTILFASKKKETEAVAHSSLFLSQ
jgi:hypothetical protein